jgi:selenocysteine lyase/cysteine desulfurase
MNQADRGVETRLVRVDEGRVRLDQIDAACDQRTRIVSVSWVGYATGWRINLEALGDLCRRRGALLFVDAIQGLGVFPLDVRNAPIDFLAADGHKWLLGPEGAGLFYMRREHLDLVRPHGLGWNSVVHAGEFGRLDLMLKPSSARYEGGTWNMAGFIGLAASLELLCRYDAAEVAARVLSLTRTARERLEALGGRCAPEGEPHERSGILSFELPGRDPAAVRKHCLANRVLLSCRAGRLRISPHAYNDESDLDRLIAALQG